MPSVSDIMETMEYGPSVEDAKSVRNWLAERGAFGHFINGSFSKPVATFASHDPASGDLLAAISQGSEDDITRAVKAARKAQPAWAAMAGHDRARFLYAIARTIQKRERFLSVLETLDNGKPIRDRATSIFRWSRAISTITRAGPNWPRPNFPTIARSAFAARSSRGISRF
ncbi:aldehyde dehydrogenase family protein [Paracoccus cavernae]|uniref:aldehyde dehydrogenase family protein n=1 Tax=Paracoccus cavernae TaxID=1571207 RepID=UPI00363770A9